MAQSHAWHTFKDPHHHTNTECGASKKTPPNKQIAGTGNKPLCMECKKLNLVGK